MRNEALLDLETIRDLAEFDGGPGAPFAVELLEMFTADAHRALLRMRVSAWLGDAGALAREAHRLKGSSGSVGATRLQAECLALERCAREGNLGELVGLEERIEHALDVLQATREGILQCDALFRKAKRCSTMERAI